MTSSKIIEVMASAIAEQFGETISPFGIRAIAVCAYTAYESHLQASGMAVVPREPTDEMYRAALRFTRDPNYGHCADTLGRAVYHAMIAACPDGKTERPPASAEAQSAVAHTPNIKAPDREKDDG
jgi:hypothetical protein